MDRFLAVCIGSAFGGGMRYLLSLWTAQEFQPNFPAATLAVNIIGSFILAVIMALGTGTTWISPTLSLALTTGVMGGFTTYSTFSYETMGQLQRGAWGMAAGNVLLTLIGCLAASFLGWAGAKWLVAA